MTALREPINTVTHLIGAIASFVGLIIFVLIAHQNKGKLISLIIYGISMIVLYAASALLHGVKTSKKNQMRLNRLDHMAIFLLIAGTYTPIVYNLFPDPWRWIVLGLIWLVAVMGMLYKLFSPKIHGVFNASIYLILSWGIAVPLFFAINLSSIISIRALYLLLSGGLVYSLGFLVYFFEKPDPWPGRFGHHEIWHLFVMGGSLCHYLFMLFYVVPYERVL